MVDMRCVVAMLGAIIAPGGRRRQGFLALLLYSSVNFVSPTKASAINVYEVVKTSLEIKDALNDDDPLQLAVTYGLPVPSSSSSASSSSFPVLLEYLPYRKDDSMYPIRFNYIDYFASRGFIYGYVDIRGTGGSKACLYPTNFLSLLC